MLQQLTIRNFKSIRDQTLQLAPLNVFIGGNGSGKSNLIQVFRFLHEIVNKNLSKYVLEKGGANNLLYFGRKTSQNIHFKLEFGEGETSNGYGVTLHASDDDNLFILGETAYYHDKARYPGKPYDREIGSSTRESELREHKHISATQVLADLDSYRVYHFHDTSDSAGVKASAEVEDNRFLRPQAENLPAFLYWMSQKSPDHFASIESTIRQVAPFFERFQLAPSALNTSRIRLEWRERGSDSYFGPTSLSDGTLRFICIATLLLQPQLPPLILLDEPELGLHPAACTVLASLLASASKRTQIIAATQSVTLVNQFDPGQVWAVDRQGGQSVFRHLSAEDTSAWMDEYALGDLWEKNVLGARP